MAEDLERQPRTGKPDVGVDKISSVPVQRGFFTEPDVGPDAR